MRYGSRALGLLEKYYKGEVPSLVEMDNQPLQQAETVDKQVRFDIFLPMFSKRLHGFHV